MSQRRHKTRKESYFPSVPLHEVLQRVEKPPQRFPQVTVQKTREKDEPYTSHLLRPKVRKDR